MFSIYEILKTSDCNTDDINFRGCYLGKGMSLSDGDIVPNDIVCIPKGLDIITSSSLTHRT